MFVLVRSIWPLHKTPEVGEVWNKMPRTPASVKALGTYNRTDIEHGLEAYTIFEVEDGKEAEGLQGIAQRMAPYNNIEGYKWQVDAVIKSARPTG